MAQYTVTTLQGRVLHRNFFSETKYSPLLPMCIPGRLVETLDAGTCTYPTACLLFTGSLLPLIAAYLLTVSNASECVRVDTLGASGCSTTMHCRFHLERLTKVVVQSSPVISTQERQMFLCEGFLRARVHVGIPLIPGLSRRRTTSDT